MHYPLFVFAQLQEIEYVIFNFPKNINIINGMYNIDYYIENDSDTALIRKIEMDSLLLDSGKFFLNFPTTFKLNLNDTSDFVFYSRLYHKIFHQPILYNKDLNYFSSIYTWLWEKDYMVTAIINDNGKISLEYVNKEDSSINKFVLSRIKSKYIIHKIRKIANLPILPYDGNSNFTCPPIIIEYKYKGKYNVLPIVTLDAPKLYIKSYRLTKKLHRIAVRKSK